MSLSTGCSTIWRKLSLRSLHVSFDDSVELEHIPHRARLGAAVSLASKVAGLGGIGRGERVFVWENCEELDVSCRIAKTFYVEVSRAILVSLLLHFRQRGWTSGWRNEHVSHCPVYVLPLGLVHHLNDVLLGEILKAPVPHSRFNSCYS